MMLNDTEYIGIYELPSIVFGQNYNFQRIFKAHIKAIKCYKKQFHLLQPYWHT